VFLFLVLWLIVKMEWWHALLISLCYEELVRDIAGAFSRSTMGGGV
jgi:hypothetical protein